MTVIPFKVNWSFEDPDDTADKKEIDTEKKGNDNAIVDEGGKRNGTTPFWKSISGFPSNIDSSGQTAVSDLVTTPGSDLGTTKITFSSSAIAGDNYVLNAQVMNSASLIVQDLKFENWSVWKNLIFTQAFQMAGGAPLRDYVSVDNVKGAFNGDAYTKYCWVDPQKLATDSGYCSSGKVKVASSNPTYLEGNLLPPDPMTEVPTPQELTDYASSTPATKAAAKLAIEAQAQTWLDRNLADMTKELNKFLNTLGLTGPAIIGAINYHPKFDGLIGDDQPPSEFLSRRDNREK